MTTQKLIEPIDISQTRRGVKAIAMPFDFDRIDRTWAKYRITSAPVLYEEDSGKLYDDQSLKGIFKNEKLRRLVSRKYVVFPNEECDRVVNLFLDDYGEKYKLKLYKTHFAYHNDAEYWELRSSKKYKIDKGDEVQLGIIVRNSLGCNVSFGADIFTFRLVCQNGAISKGKDLLSLKIKHYGKDSLQMMQESLTRRIHDLFYEGELLLEQYRIATKLKVRQEAAETLIKKVSHKYLPDYIEWNAEKKQVVLRDTGMPWWNLFNHVTKQVWHNPELSFLTKADITNVMHYVMKNEIAVAAH